MSTVYTFEWPRSCKSSVYVTGTFDNWSKSTRLNKDTSGKYTATLEVPKNKKILFKFVVDGSWLTVPEFKVERDTSGIENNVLYPDDIAHFNDELIKTFVETCPSQCGSPQLNSNQAYQSETETTSFSNVSYGDFSPLQQSELGNTNVNNFILTNGYEDDDIENLSDDLVSSAQITLSGDRSTNINRPTLVNIQEGNRQVRYYTSMSLLNKFTELFK